MNTKIVKFGGSSLADAKQFEKVANIIKADKARKFVVPSAPGKRFSDDTKVTDMLYECYDLAAKGKDFSTDFEKIKERYNTIIADLGLYFSLEKDFEVIKTAFISKSGRDYAASRGEFLNGKILAEYIGYTFVDAAEVVFFGENGIFDLEKTNEIMGARLGALENAVVPGFYGIMPNDTIKTFSRGGSDITGSIVAGAVDADIYENWTDVSGFLVCDPRIVEDPAPITYITYKELRELSYMGATVLHEDSIFPVRKKGIPINIKNTNAPEDVGTMIVENTDVASKYTITGIAGKKGFSVIYIEKDMMNSEIGFGRRVLDVLEKYNLPFEHMPSGIDTMSIIVNSSLLEKCREDVIASLKRNVKPDQIEIIDDLALIAVVGRGMKSMRGTAGRIFSALAHARVNVKMIDQGSSELNIIIGVLESDFEAAAKSIYDIFCNT